MHMLSQRHSALWHNDNAWHKRHAIVCAVVNPRVVVQVANSFFVCAVINPRRHKELEEPLQCPAAVCGLQLCSAFSTVKGCGGARCGLLSLCCWLLGGCARAAAQQAAEWVK